MVLQNQVQWPMESKGYTRTELVVSPVVLLDGNAGGIG